jgi:hypothetical protein
VDTNSICKVNQVVSLAVIFDIRDEIAFAHRTSNGLIFASHNAG